MRDRPDRTSASQPSAADVVYLLIFGGWAKELRGNRWHYAVRWARGHEVVLVQPGTRKRRSVVAEERIPGCRILELSALTPVGDVLADISERGYKTPVLWAYNPLLLSVYASTPAVARVFHATENFYDFAGIDSRFLERLEASVSISDLTVAVSEGVAAALRARVADAPITVVTNGCDYRSYSEPTPDRELLAAKAGRERIAVYAGNINGRLDYRLLARCATLHPSTLFALFGPVKDLDREQRAIWKSLLTLPNVRHYGPVDPERLPGIYGAADVGLIPYARTPVLVENGFPLKALEMCAAGLPVVSTFMRPLLGLTPGITVAATAEDFSTALSGSARGNLTSEARASMAAVCRANDYDAKFEAVRAQLHGVLGERRRPETKVDRAVNTLRPELAQTLLLEIAPSRGVRRRLTRAPLLRARGIAIEVIGAVPPSIRRVLPSRLRRFVVRRVLGLAQDT